MNVSIAEGNCCKDLIMAPGLTTPKKTALPREQHIQENDHRDDTSSDFTENNSSDGSSSGCDAPCTSDIQERLKRFKAFTQSTSESLVDKRAFYHIEGVISLIINMSNAQNLTGVISGVHLFVRPYIETPMIEHLSDYVESIFLTSQSAEIDTTAMNSWLLFLKKIQTDWERVKRSPIFKNFSNLLALVVWAGIAKETSLTWDFRETRIWAPNMELVHQDAFDIFDAVFSTVTFFVEKVSLCCKYRSIQPLFFDMDFVQLEERYHRLVLWWSLVQNGNLERVANVDEKQFDTELEEVGRTFVTLREGLPAFEKQLITRKLQHILSIKNDYVTLKVSESLRRAPFVLEFFGESSQGKTTISQQIIDALLTSAGLPCDQSCRAVHNPGDKFMSTWKTNKNTLIIDDMCNTKPEFVEIAPTRLLVDVANNQPFYANMPDISQKGKVFVEPELLVITTNKKNLDANKYSVCPHSIQRRPHAVITVQAKPEFQVEIDGQHQGIDTEKVQQFIDDNPESAVDDVWTLVVEKAVKPAHLSECSTYKALKYKNKDLRNVGVRPVVQYLVEKFRQHREQQAKIVERMRNKKKIVICPHPECHNLKGFCDEHDDRWVPTDDEYTSSDESCQSGGIFDDAVSSLSYEDVALREMCEQDYRDFESLRNQYLTNQSDGVQLARALDRVFSTGYNRVVNSLLGFEACMDNISAVALLSLSKAFFRRWDWVKIVPTPWLDSWAFPVVARVLDRKILYRFYIPLTALLWASVFFFVRRFVWPLTDARIRGGACLIVLYSSMYVQKIGVLIVDSFYMMRLRSRNSIEPAMRSFRDEHTASIIKGCIVVAALYQIRRVYVAYSALHTPTNQGSLDPKNENEVSVRDGETSVWSKVVKRTLPMSEVSATAAPHHLLQKVKKCMVYGHLEGVDHAGKHVKRRVTGLFVRPNVLLMPEHYFDDIDNHVAQLSKDEPGACGGSFNTKLKRDCCVKVAPDLLMCYVPNGGSFCDLTPYMLDGDIFEMEFTMLWRTKEGVVESAQGVARVGRTGNSSASWHGYHYSNLTMNTFKGLCGSPLVSNRKAILMGVHLGGIDGKPTGCAVPIFRKDCLKGFESLRAMEGVLLTGSGERFENQMFGKTILSVADPHWKSPVRYQPPGSQISFFGRCAGMATFRTRVRVTPISEKVTEITGSPNIYCGPIETPQYEGWQTCLANMAHPGVDYDHNLLSVAIADYKEPLLQIFQKPMWANAMPLTTDQTINGIPGKRFIDGMNMSTSIGFPLSGMKKDFATTYMDERNEPHYVFDQAVMDEINRCEGLYRKGQRAFTIAKACKKDEILSKRKCRIFFSNPITLTFLIRKYFLPLVRVLQFNPLVAECAVGVNCHSLEWEQLYNHALTFGKQRIFGGDYGKYDQKLPAQLLLASLRILIDFARECCYSEEDLGIMEAMSADIVYAIIAFNGDLIGLNCGSHVSGNSLTVILNSICGSLNLRCYFYSRNYPTLFSQRKKFRDYVKLITYGDDNIGSVSPDLDNFTIKGASEFLASHGQVYTMPDKTSELQDFLPEEQFEFLKRKSVFIPELGHSVGALSESSCFKMLHCFLREKNAPLTEEHACGVNIDTALYEWFFHGRETYELRRKQMQAVADQCGISHLTQMIRVSFDERVLEWRCKYLGEENGARDYTSDRIYENQSPPYECCVGCTKTNPHPVCPMGFQCKVESGPWIHGYQRAIAPRYCPPGLIHVGCAPARYPYLGAIYHQSGNNTGVLNRSPCVSNRFTTQKYYIPNEEAEAARALLSLKNSGPSTRRFSNQSGASEGGFTSFAAKESAPVANDGGKMEETATYLRKADIALAEFLARPQRVHTATWGTGLSLAGDFYPWKEFLANKRVANRVNNFHALKGTLKLRIEITGNPFLFGRALVYYNPLDRRDNYTNHSTLVPFTAINQSQKIHSYLNPTLSSAVELTLPFTFHEDYLNLLNNVAMQDVGRIYYRSLTPLESANGNSVTCTFTFFAWMEDVELGGPTQEPMANLTPQSGEPDELEEGAKKGFISEPASAIASAASALGEIPVIGPYAKATSKAANLVAGTAKLWGFSRPADITSSSRYANVMTASYSVANEPDSSRKMTLDNRQELSVDPAIVGQPSEDPLALSNIAGRESYMTSIVWSESDAQDAFLWNVRTSPVWWEEVEVLPNGRKHLYMPAASYVACMFENWKGTIYYRFQVACSAMHKGKLKIYYDPYHVGPPSEDNVQEQLVVDIAETPDFIVGVKNGRQFQWLRHHYPGYDLVTDTSSTNRYTVFGKGSGVLGVSVMNELTSPSPTPTDVHILVSMWAGDDFQVALPSRFTDSWSFGNQSGPVDPVATDSTIDPNRRGAPLKEFGANVDDDDRYLVNYGESIASLRTIIKRYCLHEANPAFATPGAGTLVMRYRRPAYPYPKGDYPTAPHVADNTSGVFAFCNVTYLQLVTAMFAGYRGSIRWKAFIVNNGDRSTLASVAYTLFEEPTYTNGSISYGPAATGTATDAAYTFMLKQNMYSDVDTEPMVSGKQGTVITLDTMNPVLDFEIPYLSRYRFCNDTRSNQIRENIGTGMGYDMRVISQRHPNANAVMMHVAAGEDYQVVFFQGAPVVTYWPVSSLPAPP